MHGATTTGNMKFNEWGTYISPETKLHGEEIIDFDELGPFIGQRKEYLMNGPYSLVHR